MTEISFGNFINQKKYGYAGVAAIMLGIVLIGTSLFGLQEVYYWQKYGRSTQGLVLDKYVQEECQSGGSSNTRTCIDNYYLSYHYSPFSGREYQGNEGVNKEFWKKQNIGSPVTLLYSSIEPTKSSVVYASGTETQKLLWFLTLGFGGVGVLIGIALFRRLHRQWLQSRATE